MEGKKQVKITQRLRKNHAQDDGNKFRIVVTFKVNSIEYVYKTKFFVKFTSVFETNARAEFHRQHVQKPATLSKQRKNRKEIQELIYFDVSVGLI